MRRNENISYWAAGFIGFHVANDLIKKGNEVFGIDNINSYYEVNLKKID